MSTKNLLRVVVAAALAAVISVLILQQLDVEHAGVIGGAVGGAVGAAVTSLSKKE